MLTLVGLKSNFYHFWNTDDQLAPAQAVIKAEGLMMGQALPARLLAGVIDWFEKPCADTLDKDSCADWRGLTNQPRGRALCAVSRRAEGPERPVNFG